MRLLVMVASVLLAACGGSGAAFAERANGICEDANEQVVALEPEPRIVSAEHADWLEGSPGSTERRSRGSAGARLSSCPALACEATVLTRAAVIGTGFVAGVHVDALRRLGVDVAGVVGSRPERARAKGLGPVYESVEELLADDVDVTTPNHLHHPQVSAALAAGKHVVCEKPLAMTSGESAELLALARESGLVHCTNFNLRF